MGLWSLWASGSSDSTPEFYFGTVMAVTDLSAKVFWDLEEKSSSIRLEKLTLRQGDQEYQIGEKEIQDKSCRQLNPVQLSLTDYYR